MKNTISICEAITEQDIVRFGEQLTIYLRRDAFPDPMSEEKEHFLDHSAYQSQLQYVHDRPQDRCHYLFFQRAGQEIGFAVPLIYHSEDSKCFILDFCVYPEFRGNGTGTQCAHALLNWARENKAAYAELCYGEDERRLRFWRRVGFLPNGANEWGDSLLLLPPVEEIPISVEQLGDPEDWQLIKLENGFRREIGENVMSAELQKRLSDAVNVGKITFFVARRSYRTVGMCSVTKCFSTFSCSEIALFDDFYIEPVFRKNGIARRLAEAAQAWCGEQHLSSLTVCCAPCDEEMYQALGFDTTLGHSFAKIFHN